MNIKNLKSLRGITLIALIITIIILLILSGVTINQISKDNGLFSKTLDSKNKSLKAQTLEELKLSVTEIQVEKRGQALLEDIAIGLKNDTKNKYIVSVDSNSNKNSDDEQFQEVEKIYVIYKNYKFIIDNNFEIKYVEDNQTEKDEEETDNSNIDKAFFVGEDVEIKKIFNNAQNAIIKYNNTEITNVKELPKGEYYLKYNKNNNIITVEASESASIEDFSENNYKLELKNGTQIYKDNNNSYYLNFDGINNYAQINELDSTINWKDGFTVEFEAEWNGFNRFSRIFDFGNGAGNENILVSNLYNENKMLFLIMNGNQHADYTFTKDMLIKDEKAKIKIEYNKIEGQNKYKVRFYKNSELVYEQETEYTVNNVKRIYNYLGKPNWNDCGYFKGKIYSLKITQADGKTTMWYDINKMMNEFEIKKISIVDEGYTGKIEDISGHNHKLELKNGTQILKDSNNLYYLNFDGIDDYAQINELNSTINWKDGFTVEFEAEWNEFNRFSRIFDFGNGAGNENILVSNLYQENKMLFLIMNGTQHADYTFSKEMLSKDEKAKIKIEYCKIEGQNKYKVKFYKNNELVYEQETDYIVNNIKRIYNYLGKPNWNDCGYFKGKIYSLKITQADGTPILWYDVNEWIRKSK